MSQLFVVIPVHNRRDFTQNCLHSLTAQTHKDFKVVIIDDGSKDGTSEMIREEFPEVILLHGDGNLWWTGATNLGVQYALDRASSHDHILLLNDDTSVHPEYLETIVETAASQQKALIGSVLLSEKDGLRIVDGGVRIDWRTAKYIRLAVGGRYESVLKQSARLQRVDVLTGRGTLVPTEVFRRIGLFNSRLLPHYGADYEFASRAKRHGYELFVDYGAVVICKGKLGGLHNEVFPLSWSELWESFFSMRSPNNLRYRWNFARLCSRRYLLPSFIVGDTIRVVLGSIRNQFIRPVRAR